MSFRYRPHCRPAGFCMPIVLSHEVDPSSGFVVEKVVEPLSSSLPSVEDFALKNLLDAGVDLQKVSTTILKPSGSAFAKSADSAVFVPNTKKEEVNNEE